MTVTAPRQCARYGVCNGPRLIRGAQDELLGRPLISPAAQCKGDSIIRPARSILDASFRYVPSLSTSAASTWRRAAIFDQYPILCGFSVQERSTVTSAAALVAGASTRSHYARPRASPTPARRGARRRRCSANCSSRSRATTRRRSADDLVLFYAAVTTNPSEINEARYV